MKKGCTTAPTARSESAKPQSKTTDGERSVGVFQTACNTSKFPIIDVMARGMFTAQLITRTFFTASVMFPPTVDWFSVSSDDIFASCFLRCENELKRWLERAGFKYQAVLVTTGWKLFEICIQRGNAWRFKNTRQTFQVNFPFYIVYTLQLYKLWLSFFWNLSMCKVGSSQVFICSTSWQTKLRQQSAYDTNFVLEVVTFVFFYCSTWRHK